MGDFYLLTQHCLVREEGSGRRVVKRRQQKIWVASQERHSCRRVDKGESVVEADGQDNGRAGTGEELAVILCHPM